MAHPRTARLTPGRLLVFLAAILAILLPAAHAHAEPTLAEIEKQINEQWGKLEPIIEQYNKVHSELVASQAKAAEIDKVLVPLQAEARAGRVRVGNIAAQYYRVGRTSTINALLSGGDTRNITDQLELLDYIARSKNQQIGATNEARTKYNAERVALDKLIAGQKQKDEQLAAQKKVIEAQLSELQKLRLRAYGTSAIGGSLKIGGLCPAIAIGGDGGEAAAFACAQIGKPYVWGSGGPNTYDCSGLTQAAWRAANPNINLTHYTGAQWNQGDRVSESQAQTGDLVFFFSDLHHMGIYVGNGLMVHAPNSTDVVRMSKIHVSGMPIAGFVRPTEAKA